MKDCVFVAYLFDPIANNESSRVYALSAGGAILEIKGKHDFEAGTAIVTYSPSLLSGSNFEIENQNVFDIDDALSLLARSYFSESRSVKSFIDHLINANDSSFEPYLKYCLKGNRDSDENELLDSTISVLRELQLFWFKTCALLTKAGEYQRYFEIEAPVSNVLKIIKRAGLRVNDGQLHQLLNENSKEIARYKTQLRLEYSVLNPNDLGQLGDVLARDSLLAHLVNEVDKSRGFDAMLKAYQAVSPLAKLLRSYRLANRARRTLLGLGAVSGRVHIDFNVFGTVTGRIIAKNPALQNLPSHYRKIVIPDEGKILLYPDFRQCEPGVLANDAEDAELISDYNRMDLYSALSRSLFGSLNKRDLAKLLFLFFCYGMNRQRLSRICADIGGIELAQASDMLDSFFDKYKGLEKWRQSLRQLIRNERRVGTKMGAFRSFTSSVGLGQALRGAQSQRVQGNAALILKKIILDIHREHPDIEILLPMHDALLVQVPMAKKDECIRILTEVFRCGYRAICPAIDPKVSFDEFHKE